MPEDALRDLINDVQQRLQAELQAQLAVLMARHEAELIRARQEGETEADARWTARAQEQPASAAAADSAPGAAPLLDAIRALESAGGVSQSLAALVTHAGRQARQATLYLVDGDHVERWRPDAGTEAGSHAAPMLVTHAWQIREPVWPGGGVLAVPLRLDGTVIGVLHAETDEAHASPVWREQIELLVRIAEAHLARVTALRTAQARRVLRAERTQTAADDTEAHAAAAHGDADGASRYARLLLSEVKLYNEGAVHEGRAHRDLGRRLEGEIERARRQYEERVPPTVANRGEIFHQELIHTLAGGDPSLLG